jgi:hypothetical protein
MSSLDSSTKRGKYGFDLDINSYSIEDMLEIYKIPKNQKGNVTDDYVKNMTKEIVQQYKDYNASGIGGDMPFSENYSEDDEYVTFFNEVQKRILQYLHSGVSFINDSNLSSSSGKTVENQLIQKFSPSSIISDPYKLVMMPKEDVRVQNINPNLIATPSIVHEYAKGVINPLERRTIKRIISIDTLFRNDHGSTTSADYIWNLPTPINNVLSMKLVSMEFPNIIKMFSSSRKNSIFTVHLYNVPQRYSIGVNTFKTIFVNHTETIIIPDGFYVSGDFEVIMSNYFLNAIAPTRATIVADLSSDNITYMPRAAPNTTPLPGQLIYEDIDESEIEDPSVIRKLNFNGLKFLVLEVNSLSSKTIIRTREKSDSVPAYSASETEPNYRAFDGSYATNYNYSPNFSFKLDFNVQEDKSFTEYYKEGGIFMRHVTYETRTINGQTVQVRVDPSPNGNECANASHERTHMTSKTLQCFRPKLDPHTGKIMRTNTKMRPLYKNAGWAMGFYKDIYDVKTGMAFLTRLDPYATYTPVKYNLYVESESSYGSSVSQYFFLELDDYNRNFTTNTIIAETGGGTHLGNNIIARIPINAPALNINYSNPSDLIFKQRDYFGPVKIEKLHLRLVDRYGETLDIQNNDYSVAIELITTY